MLQKKILVGLTILLGLCTNAQKQDANEKQLIDETVIKMFQALSDRDSAALKKQCTSDVSFYEYSQLWNIDTLIYKAITLNKSADFKRVNKFEFINTNYDNMTAWVTYRLQSTINRDGKETMIQWLETVILSREEKQWKVKHLHSTLISRN